MRPEDRNYALDPETTFVVTGVAYTAREAFEIAIAKFNTKVEQEDESYYFSALFTNVYPIRENIQTAVVVELWSSRHPRVG